MALRCPVANQGGGDGGGDPSSVFIMHEGMDSPHNFGGYLKTNDLANPDLIVNVLSNWIP